MRLIVTAALVVSSALSIAAHPAVEATKSRLIICAVMSDDSISWLVADRVAMSLGPDDSTRRFTIVPPSDVRLYLESSRYGWGLGTSDVRELMKMLRADVLVDIQAARSGGQVVVSVLRFESAQTFFAVRQPMLVGVSLASAADSLAALIRRDSLGSAPR